METLLHNAISSLWETEQHIYSIPNSRTMVSLAWAELTSEDRCDLRSRALEIWRDYLENQTVTFPHPHIVIPEYREMLSQPDGELIVEEI